MWPKQGPIWSWNSKKNVLSQHDAAQRHEIQRRRQVAVMDWRIKSESFSIPSGVLFSCRSSRPPLRTNRRHQDDTVSDFLDVRSSHKLLPYDSLGSAPEEMPVFEHDLLPTSTLDASHARSPNIRTKVSGEAVHIRLLRVRVDVLSILTYDLETWSLDAAPRYAALSYAWGKPDRDRSIVLNDRRHHVTSNCHYALWQALRHDLNGNSYFWMDSVCINQDDLGEKGSQVQMMGDIFSHAQCVYACVGPHADGSRSLLNLAKLRYDLTRTDQVPPVSQRPRHVAWDLWELRQVFHRELANAKELWIYPDSTWTTIYWAHKAFSNRHYWTRLWIIQETWLAHRLQILCGESQIWLADLFEFESNHSHVVDRSLAFGGKTMQRVLRSSTHPTTFLNDEVQYNRRGIHPVKTLEILAYFANWDCANFRDHFYGLLRLLPHPSRHPLPDYQISPLGLAVQALLLDENVSWEALVTHWGKFMAGIGVGFNQWTLNLDMPWREYPTSCYPPVLISSLDLYISSALLVRTTPVPLKQSRIDMACSELGWGSGKMGFHNLIIDLDRGVKGYLVKRHLLFMACQEMKINDVLIPLDTRERVYPRLWIIARPRDGLFSHLTPLGYALSFDDHRALRSWSPSYDYGSSWTLHPFPGHTIVLAHFCAEELAKLVMAAHEIASQYHKLSAEHAVEVLHSCPIMKDSPSYLALRD